MIDTSPSGIKSLLTLGESPQVEFKQHFVASMAVEDLMQHYAKQNGGILLFGVDDEGNVIGVSPEETSKFPERVRRLASSSNPQLSVDYGNVSFDGKTVLFLQVFPWSDSQALAKAQSITKRNRLVGFVIQLSLIVVAVDCLWYLRFFYDLQAGRHYIPLPTPTAVWLINAAIASVLGLIFYGSSFELTPAKLISSLPFFPRFLFSSPSMDVDFSRGNLSVSSRVTAKTEENPKTEPVSIPSREPDLTNANSPISTTEIEPATVQQLMEELADRATLLANRLEKRTTTYMVLGVIIGFIGLVVWATVFSLPVGPENLTQFISHAIPRITILIFIELLAGFFLRQYRIGIEDFKYFFEIEQRTRWKAVSYAICVEAGDKEQLKKLWMVISDNLVPQNLKSGETTGSLEAMKEPNPALEALKMVAETAKAIVEKTKPTGK